MVLVGSLIGALPKIWPWQKAIAWEVISESKKVAIKTKYTAPWNFEGDPQLLIAIAMMLFGFLFLYFLERNSNTKSNAA